ncbi:MAG: cytochrome b/b6 domain-containing protein [Gammaproteobacteria bacterium]|nr:cytochrome b/b6 domain-containing protein [Gammaproteobacteria bacterium]
MGKLGEQLAERQHLVVALSSAWLIGTSPLLGMMAKIPREPGFFDYSHLLVGLVVVPVSVSYLFTCIRGGRWRLYFPWIGGQLGDLSRDCAGLFRGRLPVAEGGGLFAVIEGLALLLLAATAVTGIGWLLAQGGAAALAWRSAHGGLALALTVAIVLHVVTVSLHLLDFVRD